MIRPSPVDWRISDTPVAYPDAVAAMEARAGAIAEGRARELVWLLEHPALYTAGTSAKASRPSHARALSRLRHGPRRPIHLSRPRPARRAM